MMKHTIERPVCKCGGYAIMGDKCADCYKRYKADRIAAMMRHGASLNDALYTTKEQVND